LPAWQTYTVRPGDTLGGIAARFGVPADILIAANSLPDANRIAIGQVLRIEAGTAPGPRLSLDGPLARVQLWPWPPSEGQTLVVWFRTTAPITVSVALADQSFHVVSDGTNGWAVIPIPALYAPAAQSLTVTAGSASLVLSITVRAGVFETEVIPPSASDPILSEAVKVQAEYERVTALFAAYTLSPWTPRARFRLPVSVDSPRTAPFGSRRTYGSSAGISAHTGEDFGAAAGTPVLAPAPGVVVLADQLFVRGNAVVIDHGRGVLTGYWHMQAIKVKVGERVETGQMLGEVGTTGLSTGPHLHWEMRVNGVAVDPMQWVEP
jgi:murein DD-endopeptidase MepM/ murein hydrolase activator NlpD